MAKEKEKKESGFHTWLKRLPLGFFLLVVEFALDAGHLAGSLAKKVPRLGLWLVDSCRWWRYRRGRRS